MFEKKHLITIDLGNIKAVSKQRPRFCGKFVYTPKKTVEYERFVANIAKIAMAELNPFDVPISILITINVAPTKSISKRKIQDYLDKKYPNLKNDLDNQAKSILDALNNIVFVDDRQISELVVRRSNAIVNSVVIDVFELIN